MSPTPANLDYRKPAEWEHHKATWLAWPHNVTDWPGKFQTIPWVFTEMVRHISSNEPINIITQNPKHTSDAKAKLQKSPIDLTHITFYEIPLNRHWTRDFGPLFITNPKATHPLAISRFGFNAWAKYNDFDKDNAAVNTIAKKLDIPLFTPTYQNKPIILEGGAIEVNGQGTLITTEECLLHPTIQIRNPGFTKTQYETMLKNYFGVSTIWWLNQGIIGDDTHGHVDDVCRFVNPTTVVACQEDNPSSPNYKPLQENLKRLQGFKLENGSSPHIITLPMPTPLLFDNTPLPASYANFYICNGAVLVPTFNDPNDRIALGILQECFPNRKVVGIHAVDLVWGLGTVHCLTNQQPG